MRLREPFNGIKHGQGHFFFHFAFLAGSIVAVRIPGGPIGTTIDLFTDHTEVGLEGLYQLIQIMRLVHLFVGCF